MGGTVIELFRFAAIMGSLFLQVGVLGFGDGFVSPPDPQDPALTVQEHYGRLFGLFPVNILHNVVHGVIGLAGLLAWRNVWSPQAYARFVGGFYAILTVMGLISGFHTMMGLVPIRARCVASRLVFRRRHIFRLGL